MSDSIAQNLPQMMQVAGFDAPGGPEVLHLSDLAVPSPGAGEVLVKVAFAGVNRPDVIQRQGFYPPPPGASPIPGLEIAGLVVALGEGSDPALLGRQICALVSGGGYAQYCVAVADLCLLVPADMSLDQAAALPETLFTVWHNVFERGWAKEGETLLVHGGTSGIGSMAIMLGKAFGLTVIVTCGGADKCAAALSIGADHAIDYKAADFVDEVARITGGQGVQIVLDMVAGDYVMRNLKCLADDGRHVTIAVQGGLQATINMAEVMRHRLTLTGSTLRPRSTQFKALLAQEIRTLVWPLFAGGVLRPVMDQTFPPERGCSSPRPDGKWQPHRQDRACGQLIGLNRRTDCRAAGRKIENRQCLPASLGAPPASAAPDHRAPRQGRTAAQIAATSAATAAHKHYGQRGPVKTLQHPIPPCAI